ncbi:hypothetical protein [Tabrizicola sp. M-4]|uniref:hypothetical protein n=1 Tax=Tabrizicola sp. M-4 TaxID=3055847 RepID=UPI003DA96ACF
MTDRHLAAARMLRIALTLGAYRYTPEGRMAAWLDFARVIAARVTDEERALIVYWTARTLPPDLRAQIFDGAHYGADSMEAPA